MHHQKVNVWSHEPLRHMSQGSRDDASEGCVGIRFEE